MRRKAIIIFALSAFLCLMVAVGCKQSQSEIPNGFYVSADSFLKWNEVKNADAYLVNIDGKEYTANKNELDIFEICTERKEYKIRVRAYGKKIQTTDAGEYVYSTNCPGAFGYKNTTDGSGLVLTVADKEKLPKNVVIPSEINGKPVVSLKRSAFFQCENITSVYIPDSVTKLGTSVFYSCVNLERVCLSANLETLSSLSFFNCKKLKNIELPSGLNKIDSGAFEKCASLEEIELPDSLTSLNLRAFDECEGIKRIVIPQFVEYLTSHALNMEEIIVHPDNSKYYSLDNCILRKSDNVIISGGQNSTIPKVATAIGEDAFNGNSLKQITVPGNIKTIGRGAFSGASLNEITIENGVEEIGAAFGSCNLKKIVIPDSVTKIDQLVYGNCKVGELSVSPGNRVYYSVDDYILTRDGNSIVAGILSNNPIPAVAEEIGNGAFYRHFYIEEITIPANIKRVCGYAFYDCANLQKVIFEGGELIETQSFSSCKNLTVVRFSKNVKRIEPHAFGFTNFASVTLPESVDLEGEKFFFRDNFTVYYSKYNDLSKVDLSYRSKLIESEILYENDFPYVKSIKLNFVTHYIEVNDEMVPFEAAEYGSMILFVPEREGYAFEGWSKTEDCKIIDYPVYVSPEGWDDAHFFYYLEAYYTYNPSCNLKINPVYDPEVKVLYAVWKKI